MGHTDGRWTQGTSTPGFELFLSSLKFKDLAGLATTPTSIATPGLIFQTVPAGDASKFVVDLGAFLREAVYATAAYDQEEFGTAAAVPGPSTVAGTSGPLAIPSPFPPIPGAAMATVAGPTSGPAAKGLQIDSIDVIYQVLADATAVAATLGLTKTSFANLVAPVVVNLIALAANGLPVVIGAQPQVTNVAVPTPAMIVATDTEVLLNINLTGGTAGTIKFYGAVVKGHFNFN